VYVADLAPCDPTLGTYQTETDWLTGPLPDGAQLVVASTGVTADQTDTAPPEWLLARIDGDRLVATITLLRRSAADAVEPEQLPGYLPDDRDARLDAVRGRPGRIARWINRGDLIGQAVAEWTEDGIPWRAESRLGVRDLADALTSLRLGHGRISDRSGRFEVIGTWSSSRTGPSRVTQLEIDRPTGPDGAAPSYFVRIDSPVPGHTGASGVPPAITDASATVRRVQDRLVFLQGPELDSTLPDGSAVTITTTDRSGVPVVPRPDTLVDILTSLHRRTPDDDRQLGSVPLAVGVGADPSLVADYCREP
jgi:hypothetical protein